MRRYTWLWALSLAVVLAGLLRPDAASAVGPLAGVKICIDPGHGGTDPGAVNAALGLYESDINLDESYALKALLEADGATVVMTRTDDTARTNAERNDFANQQRADLVISVHTNSVVEPEPNGALVLYSDAADQTLAQAIYDVLYPTLSAAIPGEEFTPYGTKRYRASILRRTTMTGALVEPAFLSHPVEAQRLAQPIYADAEYTIVDPACADLACRRGQVAVAVHQGIVNYFEARGITPVPTATATRTPTPTPTPVPTRAPVRRPTDQAGMPRSGPFPLQ